jgi:AcrR family transcriptional regulator
VSSKRKREPWRGEPLPRGRHKLSPEVVRASQRERLMRAMLECVAEHGYEATTVPQVVAAARVSRNSFYEHFEDKTECFIALCDEAATELLDELLQFAAEPDWLAAVRRGSRLYLRWWQDRPEFSLAYFRDLPTAGARAIAQRDRQYARYREMFEELARRARTEQPGLPPFSPVAARVLVLATTELVAEEVRAGRTARLAELEDDLVHLTVKLLADDATARRALETGREAA